MKQNLLKMVQEYCFVESEPAVIKETPPPRLDQSSSRGDTHPNSFLGCRTTKRKIEKNQRKHLAL